MNSPIITNEVFEQKLPLKRKNRFDNSSPKEVQNDINIQEKITVSTTLLSKPSICLMCSKDPPVPESKMEFLCIKCLSSLDHLKCSYCRIDFHGKKQLDGKCSCLTCTENLKKYGQPGFCKYCGQLSAFRENKNICDICLGQEKRGLGPPQKCDKCGVNAAFKRTEEQLKKTKNMHLCFLCTRHYKITSRKRKLEANK